MLTRSGVAKLLRRSVATVRRLEGHELFPRRDARGVHRFDESEVAEVAHRLRGGNLDAARGRWLTHRRTFLPFRSAKATHRDDIGEELKRLTEENDKLKQELSELTLALAGLLNELDISSRG